MNTNFERYHQSVISGIILIQVVSFDIINDSFYGSYLQASPTSPLGMDCLSFHSKSLSSFLNMRCAASKQRLLPLPIKSA